MFALGATPLPRLDVGGDLAKVALERLGAERPTQTAV
jgi:hypothetical protein